ncbi:MAG: YlbF family regulator [Lachnospiraceae bacterium]|nr:YlbF family regulator [Lachnospiraceae bacterium]
MLDKQLDKASREYIRAIKDTAVYKNYRTQLERIKQYPDLYRQVNEFRQRNYEIQNTEQVDELFDKIDAFEREYEKFRENPIVDEFLRAELALCRMMQKIDIFITEELDFDMGSVC